MKPFFLYFQLIINDFFLVPSEVLLIILAKVGVQKLDWVAPLVTDSPWKNMTLLQTQPLFKP